MHILIVDDEEAIAELLVESFKDEGLESVCRFNGDSAIEYISSNKPCLVLSDINMPGGSGVKILDYIKEKNLSIPVMFMTGYSQLSEKELLDRGAAYVFSKPMDFDDTVQHVISHLHK